MLSLQRYRLVLDLVRGDAMTTSRADLDRALRALRDARNTKGEAWDPVTGDLPSCVDGDLRTCARRVACLVDSSLRPESVTTETVRFYCKTQAQAKPDPFAGLEPGSMVEPVQTTAANHAPVQPVQPVQPVPDKPDRLHQPSSLEAALRAIVRDEAATVQQPLDEAQVRAIARDEAQRAGTSSPLVHVQVRGAVEWDSGDAPVHYLFPVLLAAVSQRVNVQLVGPAGSGKTYAAHQAARALGIAYGMTGAIDNAYALRGFTDAQGNHVETEFLRRFRDGGVFMFDELDASDHSAILAFNAALANDQADFPVGMVAKHADFVAIAGTNTFGNGADRQYVGRYQLDAAATDRFFTLTWDYDARLEAALVGQPCPKDAPAPVEIHLPTQDRTAQWLERVRQVRAACQAHGVRHVVSPRATINGAKLLAAGIPWEYVEAGCLRKGLSESDWSRVAR